MNISVALLALLACNNAIACSCADATLQQAKSYSDSVFVGQITRLQCSSTPGKIAVNFIVSHNFKGAGGKEAVILIENNSSACGYVKPFLFPGSTYLIFATNQGDGLETSRCFPNKLGSLSAEETRVLRAGT